MVKKRVTLRDIASACGYHFSTVSLALRGDSSIPESTRYCIKEVAAKLGYSPDPVLSALVAYRQEHAPPSYSGTIIWLTNNSPGFHWRDLSHNRGYYCGAAKEAKRRGFVLEELDLGTTGMTPARANQILHARRINCLLIPPQQPSPAHSKLDWDRFHAVTLGYGLPVPQLHLVTSNYSKMMGDLMERLYRLGYSRPGLVLCDKASHLQSRKWTSAYLEEIFRNDGFVSMSPLCLQAWNQDAFDRWFEAQQPDVLIGSNLLTPELLPHLAGKNIRIPVDIGYADFDLAFEEKEYAGMKQHAETVGRVAVSHLISIFHRNDCGDQAGPGIHTLLDGVWFLGPTVRPQKLHSANLVAWEEGHRTVTWDNSDRHQRRTLNLQSG